ncbi:2-hydroxyacid dehydrogenase [Hydrogenoanaerobacterium sp.]|uniref:2-hydroxyacid dehydrogenase n=1 Tax=Hydrogenoanaerobacterium sp. TaxID=2953763 RepID=UPI00289CE836|nr:2-hydroxyacid dehydrogenase [Hydrogenoanaerobacterium sp.]
MKRIAFFDTKPYDKIWFDRLKAEYDFELVYFEEKLSSNTASMTRGCEGAIAFVNDTIDRSVIETMGKNGVGVLAMRCAGYNNIDFKAAFQKLHVVRVPAYSPYAVAEYAMSLLLCLNRKLHRAFNRTREYNFSLNGLTGFDLHGKTAGVIGTGKIGRVFIDICRGFGMNVIAYDPYPVKDSGIEYVGLEELCRRADVISLHCPLTKETHHIICEQMLAQMKDGVYIINTSRGALIDSEALLEAIKSGKVGGAALDVYEEESDLFYEDFSNTNISDDVLARLISMHNVLITSHQAFLTDEALQNIAETTLQNLKAYFEGAPLQNEICYQCDKLGNCEKQPNGRCF